MLYDILQDKSYTDMMQKHIVDILSQLFEKDQNFGVLCRIENITFNPELPDEITAEFHPMTLFFLAGYTFESAQINNEYIIFEAGFGIENIGSVVTVPLLAIMQIIIDETPIFVNLASPIEKDETQVKNTKVSKSGEKNSMEALLSNPENKKFLK